MRFRGGDIARESGSRGLNVNSNLELAPIEIQQLPEAAIYTEKSNKAAVQPLKALKIQNFKYNTIKRTSSLANNASRFVNPIESNRPRSVNNTLRKSINKQKMVFGQSGGKKRSKKTLRRQASRGGRSMVGLWPTRRRR